MTGQAHTAARMLAAGRVLIGATLLAAPDFAAGPWVGDHARTSGARVVVRALGRATPRSARGPWPRSAIGPSCVAG